MAMSPEHIQETRDFLQTASQERIVRYLVNVVLFLDTSENLKQPDAQRVQELTAAYDVHLPQEPVLKAVHELEQQKAKRLAEISILERQE